VQVTEIEFAERLLMEGLNYEFRCHHASSTIDDIFDNVFTLAAMDSHQDEPGTISPRASPDFSSCNSDFCRVKQMALDVAQRALIFSDAPFLFSPAQTGFAIAAIVTGSVTKAGYMGSTLQKYWRNSASTTMSNADLLSFSQSVRAAIHTLLNCPALDLRPTRGAAQTIVTERAENFRRVLTEVATARLIRKRMRSQRVGVSQHSNNAHFPYQYHPYASFKRLRIEQDFTPPRLLRARKYIKVTPTGEH
jgi:hypothetical protein